MRASIIPSDYSLHSKIFLGLLFVGRVLLQVYEIHPFDHPSIYWWSLLSNHLKLLKDEKLNKYDSDDLKNAIMKIRAKDLKIQIHVENLSNEFDNFLGDKPDEKLTERYLSLTPTQRLQLVEVFPYERYEKGQRKFDMVFGIFNSVLWGIGFHLLNEMEKIGSIEKNIDKNQIFQLFLDNKFWIIPFWYALLLLFIAYFFKYIFQNDYLFANSESRREALETKIESIKNRWQ